MGDILELIKTRRTVHDFLPKFVSWENVSRVLEAGRHAPSCGNIQNCKYVLVFKQEGKLKLAELTYGQYEIAQAFVLIVVCAEPEKAERYYGSRGKNLYSIQNCAAAVQNMLLEAHSLGLATRWVGAFDDDGVKTLLSLPSEVEPQAIIALGYPKVIPEKPPKFPLESLVFFGSWRNRIRDPAKYMNDIATILARKASALTEKARKSKEAVKQETGQLVGKLKEKVKGVMEKKE